MVQIGSYANLTVVAFGLIVPGTFSRATAQQTKTATHSVADTVKKVHVTGVTHGKKTPEIMGEIAPPKHHKYKKPKKKMVEMPLYIPMPGEVSETRTGVADLIIVPETDTVAHPHK